MRGIQNYLLICCWVGLTLVHGFGAENLTYTLQDYFEIPYGQSSQLSFSLTASVAEYISSGQIYIDQIIIQANRSDQVYFNLLVFNISIEQGQLCYLQYFNEQKSSMLKNRSYVQQMNEYGCVNLTECYNDSIQYSVSLQGLKNNQALVFIQNKHVNNTDKNLLGLNTKVSVSLILSNQWFYWTVGLTCLLVINLIVITGVVLYWSIKYKKTKRRYQQFKITQAQQQQSKQS